MNADGKVADILEKSIDYPCVIFKSNANNGVYTVNVPDVTGAVGKDSNEEKSIQSAVDDTEDILSHQGNYPTPSDLSSIAREFPQAEVRLMSLDLAEIVARRKKLNA
ncbi:hypothetical protein [Companilactobacillus zhongbaensis]|uniref:hypothetical protein n=1 Tax=Companilactobacillus zhongbaensis TaxID=2486009 RepID=UPI0013DDFF33|nr:hypothetical protein [Companilactobacillus zhongbaensis]